MFIKQVSVFIENQPGALSEVLDILAENDINMSALSVADTADFGILRLIVSNPDEAKKILREKGYIVKLTDVIAVGIEDRPGGLSKPLKLLKENDIEPARKEKFWYPLCGYLNAYDVCNSRIKFLQNSHNPVVLTGSTE